VLSDYLVVVLVFAVLKALWLLGATALDGGPDFGDWLVVAAGS
jgi:hypothetical protein